MFGTKLISGFALLLSLLNFLSAEELVLEGKVRDANTHRDIPGVNVYIRELNIGAVTNTFGQFRLTIVNPDPEMVVTFQHVAYDTLELMLEEVLMRKTLDLQERVIAAPEVLVVGAKDAPEFDKDLPQTVSVIDAWMFDLRGYTDAGDLLKTDHSIQVDEDLTGKKTVSIRGGSPDEVLVLYNGIRMNSSLDNIYDISLVDLSDIQRLEVIKGSNSALYGPQAFSGVINVAPRAQQDYNIRVQQRIGSYKTNDQGLHLFKKAGQFYGGYSFQKGSSEREFSAEPPGERLLKNASEYHTASAAYNFSETASGAPATSLRFLYLRSDMDYQNQRDKENLSSSNQMITTRFNGDAGKLKNFSLSAAYQWSEEDQHLRFYSPPSDSGFLNRAIEDHSWLFNAHKSFGLKYADVLVGYQFQRSQLDFGDQRTTFTSLLLGSESAELGRMHHGIFSVAKMAAPAPRGFIHSLGFDVSFRYDMVQDRQISSQPPMVDASFVRDPNELVFNNSWQEGTIKFSTSLSGSDGRYAFKGFLNVGNNVKFPSLMQQISTRELLSSAATQPDLQPERNHSLEIGVDLSREVRNPSGLLGWQITGNFFRNAYDNKFITYFLPGTPVAVYDNVRNASINGFETKSSLFLFRKRMTMEFGASRYYFSDRSAFPFKYDRKLVYNIMLDQSGYSLQFHVFKEGEQIARLRNRNGGFSEVRVPGFTNMDLHFGKAFRIKEVKLILNASLRNLLDDDFTLEGLPLRERRYYLTLGLQY